MLLRAAVAGVIAVGIYFLARLIAITCNGVTICTFKAATGVPCPSCGLTRAAIALSHGRPVDAFLFNPLMTAVIGVCVVWLICKYILGITVTMQISRVEFWVMMFLITAAIAANWVYVIKYVG